MTINLKYKNGINKGYISGNGKGENREYLACTAVSSRWFKTLAGAKNFMEKQGYKLVTFKQSISDCEASFADIMHQSKDRLESSLPDKLEKLDEAIAATKEVCAKFKSGKGESG